jgi:hypothetical protein
VLGAVALVGCAGAPVARGTLIGAVAGAAIGAGTGALVSDPDLLGSSKSEESGNLALQPGPTIGAGAIIGVAFGALVGAMLGHAWDDDSEEPPATEAQPQAQRVQPAAF